VDADFINSSQTASECLCADVMERERGVEGHGELKLMRVISGKQRRRQGQLIYTG